MLKYHIQTVEVGSGGSSSIVFSNIPQIYDDLVLVTSLRDNVASGGWENAFIYPNGSSANMVSRALYGFSTTTGTLVNVPAVVYHQTARGNNTANTFSNSSVMFSGYSSSNNKRISSETSVERNDAAGINALTEALWSSSAPITSLTIAAATGLFVQYSYASLYGVKRGAEGSTKISPAATGGTVTTSGGYTYHTFTSSGTFASNRTLTVDALIVGGGGGGGGNAAGGGGAGGFVAQATSIVPATYTVTVGAGGNRGTGNNNDATSGGASSVFGLAAIGGGRGAGNNTDGPANASSGGSGGGGSANNNTGGAGTSGQGFAGGTGGYIASPQVLSGGGGGGASAAGTNFSTTANVGGNGGAGSLWVNGSYYAGGGGGGRSVSGANTAAPGGVGGGGNGGYDSASPNNGVDATAGTANTGGGGGGAAWGSAENGGNGGSGVVIIRYLTPA